MVWGDAEIAWRCGSPRPSGSCGRPSPRSGSACATARPRAFGPELEGVLLGDGPARGPPRSPPARCGVLGELGLVEVGEHGVRAAAGPARRELEASERYRAARRRLDEARAFLGLAPTLDLSHAPSPLAAATRWRRRPAARPATQEAPCVSDGS